MKGLSPKLLVCFAFLLLVFSFFNAYVPTASCRAGGWVNLEVLSFDGYSILFRLEISAIGNKTDQEMWIGVERPFSSGAVTIEVKRGISDVVFYESTDITVFTYRYSYNHTYYDSGPKNLGYLLFPWDRHTLSLLIAPSFNLTLDEHPSVCDLPSPNYEGTFLVTPLSASGNQQEYKLKLEITHSPVFALAVALMLYPTIIALYALSLTMIALVILVARSKKSRDLIPNLIRVSSAIVFFVPAFEIALNNLKSPLPLVFSDILVIPIIPLNASIILASILFYYFQKHSLS